MLIQDILFFETADQNCIEDVRGGVSTYAYVNVSANGGSSSASASSAGYGGNTTALTNANTRSAAGSYYQLSASTGAATATSVNRDYRNLGVSTSVNTGVTTDVQITSFY